MGGKQILKLVVTLLAISGAELVYSEQTRPPTCPSGGSTPCGKGGGGGAGEPISVPEIDAGNGGYALALLTGTILLVSERVRKRTKK